MTTLYGKFLYPAYHWLRRDGINDARRESERNQWLPIAEMLDMQQKKLSRLLMFARDNVPHYRDCLKGIDLQEGHPVSQRDIRQIPLLTKNIIRHSKSTLVSDDLAGNHLFSNSTSGSTGEPIRFYTDFYSKAHRAAAELRSDSWTGWKLGEPYVRLWGAAMDLKQGDQLRNKLRGKLARGHSLSSFDLSPPKMDEYIEVIKSVRPTLFIAYPGPMEQFAIHCKDREVSFPSIKGVVSSAETLWPHQREIIEEAFGVKVFDRYGSREVGQIASECQARNGLHISIDRLYLEVLDEAGQACPPGMEGRIVITDLDNFGMPFIRYEIGDRGTISETTECGCGRGLPLLQRVEGRTMDMVATPDGRKLGGTFWTLLLRTRPGLRQIQVVQEDLSGVNIYYVPDDDFKSDVLDYFANRIMQHCGSEFTVRFCEQESIQLTVSGKQRVVVSKL